MIYSITRPGSGAHSRQFPDFWSAIYCSACSDVHRHVTVNCECGLNCTTVNGSNSLIITSILCDPCCYFFLREKPLILCGPRARLCNTINHTLGNFFLLFLVRKRNERKKSRTRVIGFPGGNNATRLLTNCQN